MGMGRMFVGLGALLTIVAVMSFFMIKADRERVDQANIKLIQQQAEALNIGDTVAVEHLELMLKSAVLDKGAENSAVLKLELGVSNRSGESIVLNASDFVLYDEENQAIKPNQTEVYEQEISATEELHWELDYDVTFGEQFKLHILSKQSNGGLGAAFIVKPDPSR